MTPMQNPEMAHRRALWFGVLALAALVIGFGSWATTLRITQATILGGEFAIEDGSFSVRSDLSGRIDEVLIRDGGYVARGEVILRLKDPALDAELEVLKAKQSAVAIRRARLRAELRGGALLDYTDEPDAVGAIASTAAIIQRQRDLLAAYRQEINSDQQDFATLSRELDREISGLAQESVALRKNADLVSARIEKQSQLIAGGIVAQSSLAPMLEENTRIAAEIGRNEANRARADQRRAEALARLNAKENSRQLQAITRLADLDYQARELAYNLELATSRLAALELRAPSAGRVQYEAPLWSGQNVSPGVTLFRVIDGSRPVAILAKARAHEIRHLSIGATARVIITGEAQPLQIGARLVAISPGVIRKPEAPSGYYELRLAPLVPVKDAIIGRSLEIYFPGPSRRPIELLADPLLRYFGRALRES